MSEGLNRVILLGNIGAEPELRYTQGGTAVLRVRLATNETFLDRNKEQHERTDWHTVLVWGARGEALAKILHKGACVLVEGGIRSSSYEKDGQKRYKTEIYAREICLTGRRPRGSDTAIAAAGAAQVALAAAPVTDEDLVAQVAAMPEAVGLGFIARPPVGQMDDVPF